MTEATFAQQMNALQRMFVMPAGFFAPIQKNASAFWENQDRILHEMQEFANGWFDRRHTGTREACEAAQRMCRAETPVDLVREYQNWATGAFSRVMADGIACQQCFVTSCGALASFGTDRSPESGSEAAQPHIKAATRSRAA